MSTTRIIFRADGSSTIGLGHIYRSCALAQVIGGKFTAAFFTRNSSPQVHNDIRKVVGDLRVVSEEMTVDDEIDILSAETGDNDIIVLDGYHFDGNYQQRLRSVTTAAIVCIDDIHRGVYAADAVVNHIGGISIDDYRSVPYTAFFLGVAYALVNKVFIDTRPQWNDQNDLLICLGGADPDNHVMKVLERLPAGRFKNIHVIVGAGYKYREQLDAYIANKNILLYQNIPPAEVANCMSCCRYAVVSPSTVSYEYLHVGGIAYLYQIADNQTRVKEFFLANKLALGFEQIDARNVDEEEILSNQQRFFDRRSHERLTKLFEGLAYAHQSVIRKASTADRDITFEWANDPLARSMSYNNQPIPLETHTKWFETKVQDKACVYYIFEKKGRPFAQIRFDVKGKEAILSYSVGPVARGYSLGVWILAAGIRQLLQETTGIDTIIGYVKDTNIASCKSFEKLRFRKEVTTDHPGSFKYSMENLQ